MKPFVSLLAVVALSLGISAARAQEEQPAASSSPAAEESSSATIETTPSTPSTTTESLPVATPASEKSPAAMASPAAKEKPATTTTSPATEKKAAAASSPAAKTAAAAKPSMGPDKGSPESNVKRLEDEWEAAVMKHDPSFAQARVAEDYMGYSSKGKRINKAALMRELKGDADKYTSARNGNVSVRSYGPNVAVSMGTSKEVGTGKDGKQFTRNYAWTDTWMLRGNRWQCIASHSVLTSKK